MGTQLFIVHDPSLFGATIMLAECELSITEAVTIDATALPGGLTIDASGNDLAESTSVVASAA